MQACIPGSQPGGTNMHHIAGWQHMSDSRSTEGGCIPWLKKCDLCRLGFRRGPCAGQACSNQQCAGTVRTCHQVAPPAGCTSLALAWGTLPVVEDRMLDGQSMTSKLLSDNGPLSVLQAEGMTAVWKHRTTTFCNQNPYPCCSCTLSTA